MSNDAARKETRPAIAGSYVMINELQLQSRAFNSIKIVRCQLFVVRCPLFVVLPMTNDQSPITNHQSPITNHQSPIS
ncbi:MAG: hypothetical protein ACK5RT_14000 [Dolichospermum sp.]